MRFIFAWNDVIMQPFRLSIFLFLITCGIVVKPMAQPLGGGDDSYTKLHNMLKANILNQPANPQLVQSYVFIY